ncbi:MAG: hypothetical protein ACLRR3_15430 [Eubacterium sp.]
MANLILKDGTQQKVELTFLDLYKFEQEKPALAEKYFGIQRKDSVNELDMVEVLRIAYIATGGKDISFEDFCGMISNNRIEVITCYSDLLNPKN